VNLAAQAGVEPHLGSLAGVREGGGGLVQQQSSGAGASRLLARRGTMSSAPSVSMSSTSTPAATLIVAS
jgi:hypothetical protein